MNFPEKLDKVLKVSKLVSNINQLEKRIGVSTGTILKPYNEGKPPGLGTVKKIIEYLGISQEWWDTGKGDIFNSKPNTETTSFWDEIREGDYIGMHNRVWTQHELTMSMQRELLKTLVDKLVNSPKANGQKR